MQESQAKKYRDDLTPDFGHVTVIVIGGEVDAAMSAHYVEADLHFQSYNALISRAEML